MFYLISYYVLVTQMAPTFLPRLQSVIVSNQINYDVSVTSKQHSSVHILSSTIGIASDQINNVPPTKH